MSPAPAKQARREIGTLWGRTELGVLFGSDLSLGRRSHRTTVARASLEMVIEKVTQPPVPT